MTLDECIIEVRGLEAKLMRFPPRTDEDREFWRHRRAGIFQAVERFDVEVLRKAFAAIVEASQDDEKAYFPTVPEILRACREATEADKPKPQVVWRRFKPADHTCSLIKPKQTTALGMLATMSPYEAAHILCPGDVPATCPLCGKRWVVVGIFESIQKSYPADDTSDWTPNFKGMMTCDECEEAARRAAKR